MTDTRKAAELDDELARLRARLDELEADLSDRRMAKSTTSRSTRSELADSFRDNSERTVDEGHKVVRGVALASLEALRAAADVVDSFVGGVYDRNRPEGEDSVADLTTRLPGDITSAFRDAIDQALDIPNRTIDTLQSSYREGEEKRRERRGRGTQQRVERREEQQDEIRRALGRPVTRVILDLQDNVILNTGDVITHQAIRRARMAGVLDMLLDSVDEREPPRAMEHQRQRQPVDAPTPEGQAPDTANL